MLRGLGLQELFKIDLVEAIWGDLLTVDDGLERVTFINDLDSSGIEGDIKGADGADGGDRNQRTWDVSYGGLSYPVYLNVVRDFGSFSLSKLNVYRLWITLDWEAELLGKGGSDQIDVSPGVTVGRANFCLICIIARIHFSFPKSFKDLRLLSRSGHQTLGGALCV